MGTARQRQGQGAGRQRNAGTDVSEGGEDVQVNPFCLEKWPGARFCWKKKNLGPLDLLGVEL